MSGALLMRLLLCEQVLRVLREFEKTHAPIDVGPIGALMPRDFVSESVLLILSIYMPFSLAVVTGFYI